MRLAVFGRRSFGSNSLTLTPVFSSNPAKHGWRGFTLMNARRMRAGLLRPAPVLAGSRVPAAPPTPSSPLPLIAPPDARPAIG